MDTQITCVLSTCAYTACRCLMLCLNAGCKPRCWKHGLHPWPTQLDALNMKLGDTNSILTLNFFTMVLSSFTSIPTSLKCLYWAQTDPYQEEPPCSEEKKTTLNTLSRPAVTWHQVSTSIRTTSSCYLQGPIIRHFSFHRDPIHVSPLQTQSSFKTSFSPPKSVAGHLTALLAHRCQ